MVVSMYKYASCGLLHVYLRNGFASRETDYGKSTSIEDIQELHRVIGRYIVANSSILSAEEVRFLRTELDLSQSMLAHLLGLDESMIRCWESGYLPIPRTADIAIRMMYLEQIQVSLSFTELIKRLSILNRNSSRQPLVLEKTRNGWHLTTIQ